MKNIRQLSFTISRPISQEIIVRKTISEALLRSPEEVTLIIQAAGYFLSPSKRKNAYHYFLWLRRQFQRFQYFLLQHNLSPTRVRDLKPSSYASTGKGRPKVKPKFLLKSMKRRSRSSRCLSTKCWSHPNEAAQIYLNLRVSIACDTSQVKQYAFL